MAFLDKKEEVIDLILTRKGREKFAQGILNPTHYGFYDDEITYEQRFTDNGAIYEGTSSAVPRIRKTLIDNCQYAWQDSVVDKENYYNTKKPQFYELGRYDPFTQEKPAWNLTAIQGLISGSVKHVPLERNIGNITASWGEKIPQVDVVCQYDVYSYVINPGQVLQELHYDRSSDDFLIELSEENSFDERDNFLLEVYQYEYDNEGNVIDLHQLYFDGKEYNEEYVEYFFSLLTDTENQIDISYTEMLKNKIQVVEDECGDNSSASAALQTEKPCSKDGDCSTGHSCVGPPGSSVCRKNRPAAGAPKPSNYYIEED